MPSYEYVYLDNGETFQISQSIKDPALQEREGRKCRRLISKPQVIFRGDGWSGRGDGVENLRRIYERNVEQAEPTRRLARERGLDFSSDAGAIAPSDDDEAPAVS